MQKTEWLKMFQDFHSRMFASYSALALFQCLCTDVALCPSAKSWRPHESHMRGMTNTTDRLLLGMGVALAATAFRRNLSTKIQTKLETHFVGKTFWLKSAGHAAPAATATAVTAGHRQVNTSFAATRPRGSFQTRARASRRSSFNV